MGSVTFEAGDGFSVTGSQVSIDFEQLGGKAVLDFWVQAGKAVELRGLTPTESVAGSLAVLGTREAPAPTATEEPEAPATPGLVTPELLIATVSTSGAWYIKSARELNAGRRKRDRVEIVPEDELPDRAKAWINDERRAAAEAGLNCDAENPGVLAAIVNAPVSDEEIVRVWANARGGNLWPWGGRLAFMRQWRNDQNQLSGYDPANKEPVRFVHIETGYAAARRGTRDEQLAALRAVQVKHPAVRPVALYEGGVVANGQTKNPNPDWRDTFVSAIDLEPDGDGDFPSADVLGDGRAYVSGSHVGGGVVSRRLVG